MDVLLVVIGAVLGWALTVATEWWIERRRRRRSLLAAKARVRAYLTDGYRACELFPQLGAWSGPATRADPVDLALIREQAGEDDWRRIDHGVGAVNAAVMSANSPGILTHPEIRAEIVASFTEEIPIGLEALDRVEV